MSIYDILKRYKYLIITRKNQIAPLFKLLAKDVQIEWLSGCDIKEHNREFKEYFDYYKTDVFVSIDLDIIPYNNKICMSYSTYMYYSPELVFDDNTYILAKDLLTASKKSIIILNKK